MEGLELAYNHQYQMDLDWSHLKLSRKRMFEGKRPVSSEQIIYQTVKILFWRSWLCRAKIGESEGSMRPWSSQVVVTLHCTKQKLGIRIFSNNHIKVFLCSSSNFSLTCIELLSVSAIREQVFRVFRAVFRVFRAAFIPNPYPSLLVEHYWCHWQV